MEFSSQPLKLYTEIDNPCTLLLTPLHPRWNTSGIYKGTSFSAEGCLRPPPPKKNVHSLNVRNETDQIHN